MALTATLRRLLTNSLMSLPYGKELADAVDASTAQATNSTATNATHTTLTVTNATVGTRLTMAANSTVAMAANSNFSINATNGSQFGTAANQKIALWGATPIIQPSGIGELVGILGFADNAANATNMNSNGNTGTRRYTFNDVIKALKTAGILQAS